jgi:hypothetical protein
MKIGVGTGASDHNPVAGEFNIAVRLLTDYRAVDPQREVALGSGYHAHDMEHHLVVAAAARQLRLNERA